MTEQQERLFLDSMRRAADLSRDERQKIIEEVRQQDAAVAARLDAILTPPGEAATTAPLDSDETATIAAQSLNPLQLPFGYSVDGRYRIQEILGEGGFGTAYLALDQRLENRKVVLKTLKLSANAWYEKRFQEEVRALAKLDHPGIVSVSDSGRLDDGSAYLVMQYVPGRTLQQVSAEGPLEPNRASRLLSQMCESLRFAHDAGILHRDLKPGNVIVRHDGQPDERAVLIDFGIARTDADDGGEAKTSIVSGTPRYMAPEQVLGRTSAQSDLFSLGLMAAQLYLGKALDRRDGDMQAVARKELPAVAEPKIVEAIATALAFSPAERFRSVRDFETALLPMQAEDVPLDPVPAKSSMARIGIWLAAIALALAGYRMLVPAERADPQPAAPKVTLARRSPTGPVSLTPGEKVHGGDGVQIGFESSRPGYLYIVDESPSPDGQQYAVLYPGAKRTPLLEPGAHRIPESPGAWLELDGASAAENLWLIWSAQTVPLLDGLQALSDPPRYGAVSPGAAAGLIQFIGARTSDDPANSVSWQTRGDVLIGRAHLEVVKR